MAEAAVWHYSINGDERGPVTATELRRLANVGEIVAEDSVWKEGMAEWRPAGNFKGLFPPATPPEAPKRPASPARREPVKRIELDEFDEGVGTDVPRKKPGALSRDRARYEGKKAFLKRRTQAIVAGLVLGAWGAHKAQLLNLRSCGIMFGITGTFFMLSAFGEYWAPMHAFLLVPAAMYVVAWVEIYIYAMKDKETFWQDYAIDKRTWF